MKRLTLLLILSPILLFGQTRQKAIADSIKKAGQNLSSVANLLDKMPGTKVERISATDSGDYVTLLVRIRVAEAKIAALELAAPVKVATKLNPSFNTSPIVALAAFRPLLEPDTVTALTPRKMMSLKGAAIAAVRGVAVKVPTFPFEPEEPEPLAILDNILIAIKSPQRIHPATVTVPIFEEKKMEVSEMHLSDEGYALLEKMEGFSPELYSLKDGGFTIGFGFFVPYGEAAKWSKGVTLEEAERIIREKMPAYEDQVKQYINVPLTQTEFDALTMLAYNLGGFAKATSIVNDINSGGDFGMLQRDWMRFVHSKAPNVMKGLMNRRKDELRVRNEMYYQPERKLLIYNNKR